MAGKPTHFAALLAVFGDCTVFGFGMWLGLHPRTAFAGAAIFGISYLAVAIPFIRKAQRAQAQKEQSK